MLPDDGLRVVQEDAGALEIQGDADDVVSARAAEQPPQSDDGTPERFPVAPGDGHGRQAVSEAAVSALAGGPERLALPIVKLDLETLSEGDEGELRFHSP